VPQHSLFIPSFLSFLALSGVSTVAYKNSLEVNARFLTRLWGRGMFYIYIGSLL
jgi:hypothetical protein